MNTFGVGLLAAAAASVVSTAARADTILNQIGPSAAYTSDTDAYASIRFTESAFASYNTAVVDDFTVGGATTLTNVSAAMDGFSGFQSFSGVTGYEVAIYSSMAAADSSLTGDVYDKTFAPTAVTVTAPYGGESNSALVSIPTTISLPAAGTYYVAVLADSSFTTNGEVGVFGTPDGTSGTTPGGDNAVQVNPGGGFSFVGNQSATGVDAAYAITGAITGTPVATPLPRSAAAGLLLLAVTGLAKLRRRQTVGG